ncbi:Aminopeptidase S [Aquisphaera giovannonii]|uniref:Aminopeptidase S n=1 Tax=Aquisphaera giovannonii TaxID=406548 RepID=A0A5B9W0D4_9BACT|nr:M28 family metallopeptidase [Aquisphaera giovannonii]QEH34092.1 Aminopeptidase S [Aquisphaera giovannonii]
MRPTRLALIVVISALSPMASSQQIADRRDAGPAPAISADGSYHAESSPIGFLEAGRASYREAEAKALAVPTPESARKWLRELTAEPHPAGSPADYRTAVFVRDRLREWGWDAEIRPLQVLLNYPEGKPALALTKPVMKALALDESPLPSDKDSASSEAFTAFHGYGVSGGAAGQVVYANYGRPEDFDSLEKLGISVKGKIVLARYGGNFRGLKVLNAQKRGATGILIYSDPGDDGYAKGDTYPNGPFRPGSAIQRGSVQFLSLGPGDPSTPNGPSIEGAPRLPIDWRLGFPMDLAPGTPPALASDLGTAWERQTGLKRSDYFATIPSLPISYDTAREIFQVLAGPEAPGGWSGGLPLAYHVGPGPVEASFGIIMDYKIRPIWNVIATVKGAAEPDRWVMLGNHRDAWVFGAVDPSSGSAATLETCRAIGAAVKAGWKPRRTMVYASWDAEEYGLVGSTEWAEEHAAELDAKAAFMLNVDSAVSGRELDMAGGPSLRNLLLDAAQAVVDVRTGKTLREVWVEGRRGAWAAATPLSLHDPLWDTTSAAGHPGLSGFVPQLQPLGSGSDFTVFLDHLGIPCADVGLGGRYGVYHSIYDNFHWMEKFGDPEFLNHATAARLYTAIMMRAASAEVLPFRFTPYGEALRDYVDELRLIAARRARAKFGVPGQAGPQSLEAAESFDGLDRLVASVKAFRDRAAALDRALDRISGEAPAASLNESLVRFERSFLLPGGLAGRTWFKHAVYAPGVTTGYGCWPLPAIRQAVEENRWDALGGPVEETARAIDRASAELGRALGLANRPEGGQPR